MEQDIEFKEVEQDMVDFMAKTTVLAKNGIPFTVHYPTVNSSFVLTVGKESPGFELSPTQLEVLGALGARYHLTMGFMILGTFEVKE